MADVQIAVIDPEDTQLALAAPAEAVVNVAVPGIQGPVGTTGSVTIAQAGTAATPGIRFESDTNTGIYSPGADQLAVSTGGAGRLFVDAGGNVGIGTASPGYKLDVQGGTISAGNGTIYGGISYSTRLEIGSISNHDCGFITNSTTRMLLDTSGRLGIGTTSPARTLTVYSTTAIPVDIESSGNDNALRLITVAGSGQICGIQNSSGNLLFNASNAERLRIDSSGNVGIGVSSPGAKLDLAAGTGASVTAVLIRSAAANANGFQIVTDSTTDNVYLNNFYNAALRFGTNNTERLRIDSSGNVGIGTSSPGAKTEIVSSGSESTLILRNTSSASSTYSELKFAPFTGTTAASASIRTTYTQDNNSTLEFRTTSAAAEPVERMRIDSSGRVGIGTSSVVSKLHIQDAHTLIAGSQIALVENTTTGEPASLAFLAKADNGGAGNQGAIYFDAGADGSTIDNKLQFTAQHQSTITPAMTLDGNGCLGIGTTSPTTLLDVNADTVRVRTARTPASATATGATGEICWDANYIYVCTATNTWRRSAISSW